MKKSLLTRKEIGVIASVPLSGRISAAAAALKELEGAILAALTLNPLYDKATELYNKW